MDSASLHELLRSTYDKTMPLYSEMTGIAKGVAGLDAPFYIVLRVWAPIARAEAIDVSPLLHPFVLGFCIMLFPTSALGTMNAVLSSVVQDMKKIVSRQGSNLVELTAKRNKLQEDAYLHNPETVYLALDEKFDERVEEMGAIGPKDTVTTADMYIERAAYQTKQWVMKMVHDLMELLFRAAGLIIDTLRTFTLIMLSILGPIVFGIAVWDGLTGSFMVWFSRYISVHLRLPVSSILTALLTKIQALVVQKGVEALSDPNYLPGSGTWYYIVFFLISIVSYFYVPAVAGWVIETGGGVDSYGRDVSQTAQRGAQGAYMGGRCTAAGAGSVIDNVGGRIKSTLPKGK